MGLPMVAIAVVTAAAAAKTVTDISSAETQKKALDAQAQQSHLQYLQKTNSNYAQVQHVLGTQINQAAVRGYTTGSASFNAVQRDTVNTFSKEQTNLDTESDYIKRNIKMEKHNVNMKMLGDVFGNIASAAAADFDIYNSAGSLSSTIETQDPAPIVQAKPYVSKLKRQTLYGK